MDDFLVVLREEFEAAENTFMLALRGKDLAWDRAGFTRLERAMRRACEWSQGHDRFDRWMAEGFYGASRFVRDWTSHPNFPRPEPEQYHLDCLDRIDDLADWFFHGFHAYQEPHTWPDL